MDCNQMEKENREVKLENQIDINLVGTTAG